MIHILKLFLLLISPQSLCPLWFMFLVAGMPHCVLCSGKFSVSSSPRTPRLEGFYQNQTHHETPDMGEEGYVGFGPHAHAEQLNEKPESQNNQRGKANQADEKKDKHQGQDSRVRKKKQVSPKNPGHRPAGTDHGNRGIGDGKNLRHGGRQSAKQIENEKAKMTECILDIVTKDPEIKHVAEEVQEPAMEKHRRKNREANRNTGRKIIEPFAVNNLVRNRPPFKDESSARLHIHRNLVEKNQNIRQNEPDCHKGKRRSRVVVFQRKKQSRFPAVFRFSFDCKALSKALSSFFAQMSAK